MCAQEAIMTNQATDSAVEQASDIIKAAQGDPEKRPVVKSFFDEQTFTVSHVVRDPGSRAAAIIDSVLDYDAASGRTMNASARALIDYIHAEDLEVQWLLA